MKIAVAILTTIAIAAIARADDAQNISDVLGIERSSYEKISGAVRAAGIDELNVQLALKSLMRYRADAVSNGDEDQEYTFKRLGLTWTEVKSLPVDEMFYKIADSVKNSSNRTQTFKDVSDAMGVAGEDLIPALRRGSQYFTDFGVDPSIIAAREEKKIKEQRDAEAAEAAKRDQEEAEAKKQQAIREDKEKSEDFQRRLAAGQVIVTLKKEVSVPNQYGAFTIPAGSRVILISIDGDKLTIRSGGVTTSISKGAVDGLPQ